MKLGKGQVREQRSLLQLKRKFARGKIDSCRHEAGRGGRDAVLSTRRGGVAGSRKVSPKTIRPSLNDSEGPAKSFSEKE